MLTTTLRKNVIKTFDNLLMKFDFPSLDDHFLDIEMYIPK